MPNPTHISVAVVENDNGQFLVGCRPDGVALAGFAEFPGGKIEPDESPAVAAVRECLEETGVRVAVVTLLAEVSHQYDHGILHLHFFQCRPVSTGDCEVAGRRANSGENGGDSGGGVGHSFRWVSRNELASLEFPAANRAVVDGLLGKVR